MRQAQRAGRIKIAVALSVPWLGALSASQALSAASSHYKVCRDVRTTTYYDATKIRTLTLPCESARAVARKAATAIAAAGTGGDQNIGFSFRRATWGCYFTTRGADSPFRVHCFPLHGGSARVNFTAAPKE